MSVSSAANCGRCGAALPGGAGASVGSRCPLCGEPVDPDATWRPGLAPAPPASARVDLPARLPLGPLALLAVVCALMGLTLGIWLSRGRSAPARRVEVSLPPLPPPGPPVARPVPASQFYPPHPVTTGLALPPARISPPSWRGGDGETGRPVLQRWSSQPGAGRGVPPVAPSPRLPPGVAPLLSPSPQAAPLTAAGLATVHVTNPSSAPVDVVLAGQTSQHGVVGPRAVVDFLIPPGRYDVTLHGLSRIQRFYDARVDQREVLSLVYSDRPPERAGEAPRGER